MAVTLIIFGSILGFFGALAAFLVAGATLSTALLIWALSGPALALLVTLPRMGQSRTPAHA